MRVSYSPNYFVSLPAGHRFPMAKFPLLHGILLREGIISRWDVVEPQETGWGDLRRVHEEQYLTRLAGGTLTVSAIRRLGLPWSAALVRRSRLAVQGTVNAAFMALEDGIAGNLAGGTHHAFGGHGEGFCVLNDVAVAIQVLKSSGWIRRCLVVDLDVHQGNGTAHIFRQDPSVFTFSMHGERNYPFRKVPSSLDVALPDETSDHGYLRLLEAYLPEITLRANPDLVFYLAGIDPVQGDRFGRLALTREGIRKREEIVLRFFSRKAIPLAIVISGGYAKTPEETADLHATVYREAARIYA
ncbi:MAG: histone deacetylase [Acidobacteriota bacterium]